MLDQCWALTESVCCLYPPVLRSDDHVLFSHIPQCWTSYRVNWVKGKICTTFCKPNQFMCLKGYEHLNKKVWFWPLDLDSLPNLYPTTTGCVGWEIKEFEGHIIACPEEQATLTGTGLVSPPRLRCHFVFTIRLMTVPQISNEQPSNPGVYVDLSNRGNSGE